MQALKKLFSSHMGMMVVCCAAMIGAYYLFADAAAEGSVLAGLAPVIACVGMHLVMMKMMGGSCHGDEKKEKEAAKEKPCCTLTKSQISTQENR